MSGTPPREPQSDRPQGVYLPSNYDPNAPDPNANRPHGRRRLLIILASLLGGFVACAALSLVLLFLLTPTLRSRIAFIGGPPAGAPPEAPSKPVEVPAGPVTISDDFSSDDRRWERSTSRVVNGSYELSLALDNFDSYGLFVGGNAITDFDMAVDATMTAGPPEAEYGIRFRQAAPDDHLMFSISPNGFYRLVRVRDSQYTSLVPWTRDDRIQTGVGATNRLRVVATGGSIVGSINGAEVLRFTDPAPQAGQLTLGLTTFDQGGLTVRFANVEGFALGTAGDGQQARLTLNENFADPGRVQWSQSGAEFAGGGYEIAVVGPVMTWQQPLPMGSSRVTGNFSVEVDATLLEGQNPNSGYGLVFGDNGAFEFYALMMLPGGQLTIIRNGAESAVVLPPVPISNFNTAQGASNTIRMEIRDRTLNLAVNGQPIEVNGVPVQDIPLPETIDTDGMVGVLVQSADPAGIRVRFDNFQLQQGS